MGQGSALFGLRESYTSWQYFRTETHLPSIQPALAINSLNFMDLGELTYDSMPDGYMLNIWVLVSNLCDCMLQSVRETLLIGFEISPASTELVFTMGVL